MVIQRLAPLRCVGSVWLVGFAQLVLEAQERHLEPMEIQSVLRWGWQRIRKNIAHTRVGRLVFVHQLIPVSTTWRYSGRYYLGVEIVAVPIPSLEELHLVTGRLGPGIAIRKRSVETERDNAESQKANGSDTTDEGTFTDANARNTSSDIIVYLAESNNGKVESREVVVQEKLTLHEVEWEVVECPPKHRGPNLVVKSLENRVVIVLESPLPSQDSKTLERNKYANRQGRAPPDNRVANKVDLTMVFAPEVDATLEDGPGRRSGVPRVRLDEAGVGAPHNLLQLPEFPEETGISVVYFFCGLAEKRVLVLLDVPHAVGEGSTFGACDFLLL